MSVMKVKLRVCALALAPTLGAAGCMLPVTTGAPLPPTTVGKGQFGVALSGEFPTLNLISDNRDANQRDDLTDHGEAIAIAATGTLAYGLGDDTDLELALEGALYYAILPLPTGGSIGLRQHIAGGDTLDIGLAARIGGVTTGGTTTTSEGTSTTDEASAAYAAVEGIAQFSRGVIRPLLSLNVMGFRITRAPEDEPIQRFKGISETVTFGLSFVSNRAQITPYAALTTFESEQFRSSFFVSGGIAFAFRRDRNRREPPPPPAYPAGYPPAGQPYPPPGQPLPPPPMP